MAFNNYTSTFACILLLLQISTFCFSLRLPVEQPIGQLGRHTLGNIPKEWTVIGPIGDTLYWQESLRFTQSQARSNCADAAGLGGDYLARFPSSANLDFVSFSEKSLDGSWTDGITFYERSMYQPTVDSTITISHYPSNFALKTRKATRSLQPVDANTLSASICEIRSVLDTQDIVADKPKVAPEEKEAIFDNVDDVVTPDALVNLGAYGDYHYWMDTVPKTLSAAKNSCEAMNMHLATFPNKLHLDYVISKSALDRSWTGYFGSITRDVYKWGNGSPISSSIPIDQYPYSLGLVIRIASGSHRLEADMEYASHPVICMIHINSETKGI